MSLTSYRAAPPRDIRVSEGGMRHGEWVLAFLVRIVAPAPLPGGYSVGVPPDPIPNSAVKPACANGTIAQAMEE